MTADMAIDRAEGAPREDAVIDAIRTVRDPELPINVFDLGLIYDLAIDAGGAVTVAMTLTTPNCPVADAIPRDVERAIRAVPGVSDVHVSLVWDPPWSPDRMSEDAVFELEAMGIDARRTSGAHGPRMTGLSIGRTGDPPRSRPASHDHD